MKKIVLVVLALSSSSSLMAGKYSVNVDVDIKTRTNFRDCEVYANAIVQFTTLLISAQSNEDRRFLRRQIKDMKKNLHRCEKKNKSEYTFGGNLGVSRDIYIN